MIGLHRLKVVLKSEKPADHILINFLKDLGLGPPLLKICFYKG